MLIHLMCCMTYLNTSMQFMSMSKATKINFLRLRNFCLLYIASTFPFHAEFWCTEWPTLTLLCSTWPCPRPPRSTSWGWRTFTHCTLHLLHLFTLVDWMCCMTYINTSSPFMAMSMATKINFLGLENFYTLYIASTLPLHTDRFDVLHDLLQPCFTLHDHV